MHTTGVNALLLSACLLPQGAKPLDELIARTNALERFVAVYRVSRPEDAEKIQLRMQYLAPDNLRLELSDTTVICLRAGVMDLRSAVPGSPPSFIHVPMAEMASERSLALAAVVHTEFPALAAVWPADADCGGQFQLNLSKTPDGTRENVDLSVSYLCPRKSLLGWLESLPAAAAGAPQDGEHTGFPTPAGGTVTLSTRSGFVESVRKKDESGEPSFRLESLDFEPKLAAETFTVPPPSADAVDGSADFGARWQETLTSMWSRRLVGWLSARVSEGKLEWNADARVHARKTMGALFSDGIALESQPWMAATRDRVEKFGTWLAERHAALAPADKAAREQLEATVRDARAKLAEILGQMVENRVAGLGISEDDVHDAELRQSLLELEQGAFRGAFAKALQEPALASFDERIERAKR